VPAALEDHVTDPVGVTLSLPAISETVAVQVAGTPSGSDGGAHATVVELDRSEVVTVVEPSLTRCEPSPTYVAEIEDGLAELGTYATLHDEVPDPPTGVHDDDESVPEPVEDHLTAPLPLGSPGGTP
jgi:hypothetical protein